MSERTRERLHKARERLARLEAVAEAARNLDAYMVDNDKDHTHYVVMPEQYCALRRALAILDGRDGSEEDA